MCGIVGIVDPRRRPEPELVRSMRDALAHRGPDHAGEFLGDVAALGHRRLSIIDLSTGDQPMSNDDDSVRIVFNGEVYNFLELRKELITLGYQFRTTSDTETIVHAYEEWGDACVARLRGMFAFAIWDEKRQRLFVARDRLGKKPLYWALLGPRFLFGSELKALLQHPGLSREVNRAAVVDYLDFGYVPAPMTIYAEINKLAPGHTLVFERGAVSTQQYWDFEIAADEHRVDEEQLLSDIEQRLEDCVRIRMITDVPLGAFLSGGLDSSLVVALMSRIASQPVKTFSIGFREKDFNELPYARAVARHFGTEHHELVVEPDIAGLLIELAAHFDEPFSDSSMIPTYLVSRFARSEVKVVLTGDGGDEVFAGYDRYVQMTRATYVDRIPGARCVAQYASRFVGPTLRRKLEILATRPDQRELVLRLMFRGSVREALLVRDLQALRRPQHPSLPRRLYGRGDDHVNAWLYNDMHTYLPEDILVKVDRASMYASLEARAPLLDHTLVEFMGRIPSSIKVKGHSTKYLLKRIARRLLPRAVIDRPKMGFSIPTSSWISGSLARFVKEKLHSRALAPWVTPAAVRQLLDEHARRAYDHSAGIFTLLSLSLWAESAGL